MQDLASAPRADRLRAVVTEAARSWRAARDGGLPAQPSLYCALERSDCGLLAPAFDSVMRLCERCLDRSMCVGCPLARASDETLIGDLVADPAQAQALFACEAGHPSPLSQAFICALRSTRIMLEETLAG
ncbi:hypothetical protein [Methylocella sp.]|uniref:hypothetical protein n=1 Tax=Methylocella sp. TaxID=1978226 RepID=UPI003783B351